MSHLIAECYAAVGVIVLVVLIGSDPHPPERWWRSPAFWILCLAVIAFWPIILLLLWNPRWRNR